jgi:hypothetical protein
MSTVFSLVPYVGAIPVTFEMSSTDVESVIGPPSSVETNFIGERDERRDGLSIRYSIADGKVVEVSFLPGVDLVFEGRNMFKEPDLVGYLRQFDQEVYEYMGFLIFLDLGITVTGFHDNDDAQKAIVAFRKGRMANYRMK